MQETRLTAPSQLSMRPAFQCGYLFHGHVAVLDVGRILKAQTA